MTALRQWVFIFLFLAVFVGITSKMSTAYAGPLGPSEDFIFCHTPGVNDLGEAPAASRPLLKELINSNAKHRPKARAKTVPLLFNGMAGLHLTPYSGFSVSSPDEKHLRCFLLIHDD